MNKWDKYKVNPKQDRWSKYKESPSIEDVAEKRISQRPSSLEFFKENPLSIETLKKYPVQTPLNVIGTGFEIAEGIPSDILLNIQKSGLSNLKQIPEDISRTISGERPAQFGDVFAGAGLPEPISNVAGLLASGFKYAPTEMLAQGTFKATKLADYVGKYGKQPIGKIFSLLSGIPEHQVSKALDNPNFLSAKWVDKNLSKVSKVYNDTISRLRNDNTAVLKFDQNQVSNFADNLQLFSKTTEPTVNYSKLKPSERKILDNILYDLGKGQMSWNSAESVISKMDDVLKPVYKKIEKTGEAEYTRDFKRIASQIRNFIKTNRDTQFPDAAKIIDEYSNLKTAQTINKSFSKFAPKIERAAIASAVLGVMGVPMSSSFSSGVMLSSPAIQSALIKIGNEMTRKGMPIIAGVREAKQRLEK